MGEDLDALLDMLENEANNGAYYELDSYEQEEAFEVENFLVNRRGRSRSKARRIANVSMKRPTIKRAIKKAISTNSGQGLVQVKGNAYTPKSAAQFDLIITRDTNTIAQALPFALFGHLDAENGYRGILRKIPVGVTLVGVEYGEISKKATSLVFTYTDGVNTDTVTVTCNQYPYPSFLKAMSTDMFKMSQMRYSISDATQLAQFNEEFEFISRSMFGKDSRDTISIASFKDPRQFQSGIIDIKGAFNIDKETAIASAILPIAGFQVTLSAFVEKKFNHRA